MTGPVSGGIGRCFPRQNARCPDGWSLVGIYHSDPYGPNGPSSFMTAGPINDVAAANAISGPDFIGESLGPGGGMRVIVHGPNIPAATLFLSK